MWAMAVRPNRCIPQSPWRRPNRRGPRWLRWNRRGVRRLVSDAIRHNGFPATVMAHGYSFDKF
jgi:hypothetical protein